MVESISENVLLRSVRLLNGISRLVNVKSKLVSIMPRLLNVK